MRGSRQGCSIVIDWFHPKNHGIIPFDSRCPNFYGTNFFPFQVILHLTNRLDWLDWASGVCNTNPSFEPNLTTLLFSIFKFSSIRVPHVPKDTSTPLAPVKRRRGSQSFPNATAVACKRPTGSQCGTCMRAHPRASIRLHYTSSQTQIAIHSKVGCRTTVFVAVLSLISRTMWLSALRHVINWSFFPIQKWSGTHAPRCPH